MLFVAFVSVRYMYMQNRACLILVKSLTIKIKGERGGGVSQTYKTPCPYCVEFDYKYVKQNPGSIYGEHGMRFHSLKNICHATHHNNIIFFVAFVSVQYMQNSA